MIDEFRFNIGDLVTAWRMHSSVFSVGIIIERTARPKSGKYWALYKVKWLQPERWNETDTYIQDWTESDLDLVEDYHGE